MSEVEIEWRKKAEEKLQAHPDYNSTCNQIKAAWESAETAVDRLHAEQATAGLILRDSVLPPPELPAAEPDAAVPPALFDSEADFVTATRQLIGRKKLTE